MTIRKSINELWHLKNTLLSLVRGCQGNDKEAINISRAFFYTPLYHLFKKLGYKHIVLLFTIAFTAQTVNGEVVKPVEQSNQEKTELLRTYQSEIVDLKTRIIQLETEVFIGGYSDLIFKYQKIIKQLEGDIDKSHNLSSVVKRLNKQQAEIKEMQSGGFMEAIIYFIFSVLVVLAALFFMAVVLTVLKDLFKGR